MSGNGPIYDRAAKKRPMRVAAFMSGSGTNVVKLLEMNSPHFEVAFIFSDRTDGKCRGQAIAHEYGLPYFARDIRRFHSLRGLPRTMANPEGREARREYDRTAAALLQAFEVDVVALGGYMSFLTLPGAVNVHPADLSLVGKDGLRLYVGDDAVLDAISAGERELRSSTLWTDMGVDSGPLLMVSDPLPVELPLPLEELLTRPEVLRETADRHQDRLKEAGDWVVFPRTIELIAQGRLGLTQDGVATLDGKAFPRGVRPTDMA